MIICISVSILLFVFLFIGPPGATLGCEGVVRGLAALGGSLVRLAIRGDTVTSLRSWHLLALEAISRINYHPGALDSQVFIVWKP